VFFFEKKNQKTFIHGVHCRRLRDSAAKVFCFFFSKKKAFPLIRALKPAILCLLALPLARSARLGPVGQAGVYVWQRHWSPALVAAVDANAGLFQNWHVLAAEISAGNQVFRTQANWAYLGAGGHGVMPVIRIDGRIDAVRSLALIALIRREVAALPEGMRGRLEIDHDSATARLADYAGFLRVLRQTLPVEKLSVTALPTWLHAAGFSAVADAADLLILQVHAIDDPRLGVFDKIRAARWVTSMARRTTRPFLVSLPAYGARVVVGSGGQVVAVSGEMPALDGPGGMEVAASPKDVADFIDGVQRDPPDGLRGFVWFRLPTRDDRRAWHDATLRAVVRGEGLHPAVNILTRQGGLPGLTLLFVGNDGDIDATLPQTVRLPAGCERADGLGMYRRDGAVLRVRGSAGEIGPHSEAIAGWTRCAKDDDTHAP
jgi:hypothetical protein